MFASSFRISRYEIKSPIGGGGMGSLYLARDPNTGRLVALKLLRAHLDSADLRARFAREAQALAALSHPNIVNIYDSGEFRGAPFIVMEYVRGETLAEKIKRRAPLSLGQKLKLMSELGSGLAHAHEYGIVHRDIKPANLMVDQYGRLKIVDFGIARVAEGLTRYGLPMTQLNMQIGTPGYMAPEQIEGGEIDQRADIFAAGAVFYELLCHREAFTGTNARQIERRVLESAPAPLASLVEGLDPAIAAIVDRALEKDPASRFQDGLELEAVIEHQRLRMGVLDTPAPAMRPTPVPANPGLKSRESRAEAAFQRCLAVYGDGAFDTARRFAIEALAEDPAHDGARELLSKVEPNHAGGLPQAQATARASVPSMVHHEAPLDLATILAGQPTELRPHTEASPAWNAPSDPTVVGPPRRARSLPLAALRRFRPRYGWALVVVVALALASVIAIVLVSWPGETSHQLTVERPAGGTIISGGITCGTAGSDCVRTIGGGDTLEFEARPDEGFAFTGFTGDCAPGGRVLMSASRNCGATFIQTSTAVDAADVLLLSVAPPAGGSIVGAGIACGSIGTECSSKVARGTLINLKPLADEGFTFRGFSGDCAPRGETLMEGPRTCGATFARVGKAAAKRDDTAAKPPPLGPRGTSPETPASGAAESSASGSAAAASKGESPRSEAGRATERDKTSETSARGEIQRALTRYRSAYEKLDFQAIRRVFPTAPEALQWQLRQYRSLEYAFSGEPEFIDLDAGSGIATVEVDIKMVFRARVGGAQPPNENRVRFEMFRRGDDWLIDKTTFLKR